MKHCEHYNRFNDRCKLGGFNQLRMKNINSVRYNSDIHGVMNFCRSHGDNIKCDAFKEINEIIREKFNHIIK